MPSAPRHIREWDGAWLWLRQFLKEELRPYAGRGTLVARMVISATLVMIIVMTFRIPNGVFGAFYALIISREDTRATLKDVRTILIGFMLAAVYIVVGAAIFAGDPMLRMLWGAASLFVVFYLLNAMSSYTVAIRYGYLIIVTIPLWDRHITAEAKVDLTLWTVWAVILAILIAAAVELVFAALKPNDSFMQPVDQRLRAVVKALRFYAAGQPVAKAEADELARLALRGMSRLRRMLQRSASSLNYEEQMGAFLTILGRLIDVSASVVSLPVAIPESERPRIAALITNIENIRHHLLEGKVPPLVSAAAEHENVPGALPFLQEIEQIVRMIPEIFNDLKPAGAIGTLPAQAAEEAPLFVPDALTNPQHIKFALKGCLAATLCYIIYTSLAWQDLSTSITTCYLTALSTIGSSRQKQFLRFIGALIGGGIGIACQVFVLPNLDSITGFAVLFGVVTFISAWISTSSPRLSYMGLQIAVAFYLINLQEFTIQTSLAVARDRVGGVLLGLFVMWIVFDQLWGVPAATEVRRTAVSILRSLATLMRAPFSKDFQAASEQSYVLRDQIDGEFNHVRDAEDAILFEFGPLRDQHLALRSRIKRWQPRLRMVFITRIALLKYRLRAPGFVLPEVMQAAQMEFDEQLARSLDVMADRLEGKERLDAPDLHASLMRLEQTAQAGASAQTPALPPSFLPLCRRIAGLAHSLQEEI